MFKRIPHTSADISGDREVKEYVQSHEKHGQTQFKAFLNELTRQEKKRELLKGGRFLEIGSGPGFLTKIMADSYPQAELNALELSPHMIAMAKKVVSRTQPPSRVRFIEGSVDNLCFMAHLGKFDLVYSTFSLHHWEYPVKGIKSLYHALKKGGVMMLHDLKRVSWLYPLPSQNGFINSIRAAYRPAEIKKMIALAGINDFRIRTAFPYFWHTILIEK